MDSGRVWLWAESLRRKFPERGLLLCHGFSDGPGSGALILRSKEDVLQAKVGRKLDTLPERHPWVLHVKDVCGVFILADCMSYLVRELGVRYMSRDFGDLPFAFVHVSGAPPGTMAHLTGIMLVSERSIRTCYGSGVFSGCQEVYFYTSKVQEMQRVLAALQPGLEQHVHPPTHAPGFCEFGTIFFPEL